MSSKQQSAIRKELEIESDTLLIAFGSMRLNRPDVPFEYDGVLRDTPAKKIFIRDPYQYWYQRGLPGIADSLAEVGAYLKSLIAQQSVKKVVILGGSMGGYAALYFSWYVGASETHAFAPKTFLSPQKRLFYGDFQRQKWKFGHPLNQKLMQLQIDRKVDKKNLDLKKVMSVSNNRSCYYLHYNRHNRLDRIHCERMQETPGVELIPYQNARHHISKDLKESGKLADIIQGILIASHDR